MPGQFLKVTKKPLTLGSEASKKWSERRGSNSRHPPWQGGALPTELRSLKKLKTIKKGNPVNWNFLDFKFLSQTKRLLIARFLACNTSYQPRIFL